jgi:Leucine-rich repeat (LRR) protein
MEMRGILFLLLTMLMFCEQSSAQTVFIPDTNFRNCLKTRYPATLNNQGRLIVSEAAKIMGRFACVDGEIENVSGIEYFTNISELILYGNRIDEIPSLSGLKSLTNIDIANNDLERMPDISGLSNLRNLAVQRNHISRLPRLDGFPNMESLIVHNNDIQELPDFSKMTKLTHFNVAHNHLSYLPNLDKLTQLQSFFCQANDIVDLPDLKPLTKLTEMNAAYNNLSVSPEFAQGSPIKTVYLEFNDIRSVTDYSHCANLTKMRLYNNQLTFGELLKLTTKTTYDTIFKIVPQDRIKVGKRWELREKDTLKLSTGIDATVQGIKYEWYKNGTLVGVGVKDKLQVPNVSMADSGKYVCVMKHDAFPSLQISTDTFRLGVKPCVEIGDLAFLKTETTCLTNATLNITGQVMATQKVHYELEAKTTGQKKTSESGSFTGLTEPVYKLKIRTANGCEQAYRSEITLVQKDCDEVLISPNGDGLEDAYFFPEQGKVTIYDKQGNVIKTLSIPSEWDGTSAKGKVPCGFYVADINNNQRLLGITVLY